MGNFSLITLGATWIMACLHLLCEHDLISSLRFSDTMWRHKFMSTLAQIMACCLTAPSHYLNQCWLIISMVPWHSPKGYFTRNTSAINNENELEMHLSNISLKFPRGQWVKINTWCWSHWYKMCTIDPPCDQSQQFTRCQCMLQHANQINILA